MILSYRDKRTAAFANRENASAFRGIEQQAWKRLRVLGAASSLIVLRALRSNRLEALKGDKHAVFAAAKDASKAVDYLIEKSLGVEVEQVVERAVEPAKAEITEPKKRTRKKVAKSEPEMEI